MRFLLPADGMSQTLRITRSLLADARWNHLVVDGWNGAWKRAFLKKNKQVEIWREYDFRNNRKTQSNEHSIPDTLDGAFFENRKSD